MPWATPIWVPADSPYVTSVGETTLNMGERTQRRPLRPKQCGIRVMARLDWPITANNYWGSGGGGELRLIQFHTGKQTSA